MKNPLSRKIPDVSVGRLRVFLNFESASKKPYARSEWRLRFCFFPLLRCDGAVGITAMLQIPPQMEARAQCTLFFPACAATVPSFWSLALGGRKARSLVWCNRLPWQRLDTRGRLKVPGGGGWGDDEDKTWVGKGARGRGKEIPGNFLLVVSSSTDATSATVSSHFLSSIHPSSTHSFTLPSNFSLSSNFNLILLFFFPSRSLCFLFEHYNHPKWDALSAALKNK